MGLLNYWSYFTVLGVNKGFLDINQYEYTLNGIYQIYVIFFVAPLVIVVLKLWIDIANDKIDVINIQEKLNEYPKNQTVKLRKSIDQINNNIQKLKVKILNIYIYYAQFYIYISITFIIISLILYYFTKNLNILDCILLAIQFCIMGVFLLLVKVFSNIENMIIRIQYFMFLPIMLIFILPTFNGFFEAKIKLQKYDFDLYSITLKGKTIKNSKLIYLGKENYFFFINDKMTIIPRSEILLLEKD